MRARGYSGKTTILEFGEWIDIEGVRVQLLPAGHILGSSLVHIQTKDQTILYTGDYRFPASPTSEGIELPEQVDVLITEATFALPIYKWQEHEMVFESLRNEVQVALSEGKTPIILAYSLGKSQEVIYALKSLNLPIQVHAAAYALCKIYERFGIDLGNYVPYKREEVEGQVLVCTHSAIQSGTASNVKKPHFIYVSGWATVEARKTQLGVDAMIPLSDHIDFFELLNVCKKLSPKKIWITHTPDPKVVLHFLDHMGFNGSYLDVNRQEEMD